VSNPAGVTVHIAELACLLCGNRLGALESLNASLPPLGLFRDLHGQARAVADWRRQRCERCGGAPIVEEVRQVTRFPTPAKEDGPRRGRPPKWLVEQRKREAEIRGAA
jgi:hypothetical protein